jgi:hypothetical protein
MVVSFTANYQSFFFFLKGDKFRDIKGTDLGRKEGLNQ